jgi:hypothetical protein
MTNTPDVTDLDALAHELRLTPAQRAFAQALAADPEQNRTAAAITAGVKPGKNAEQSGSRWSRMVKIQSFVAAISQKALLQAQGRLGEVVLTRADLIAENAKLALRTKGGRVVHRVRKDREGNVVEETTERTEDGAKALAELRALYDADRAPAAQTNVQTLILQMFGEQPDPERVRGVWQRLVRSNGD